MKLSKYSKRLALAIAVAIVFALLPASETRADATHTQYPAKNNSSVIADMAIESYKEAGTNLFVTKITVYFYNESSADVSNWRVEIPFEGSVTYNWVDCEHSVTGGKIIATPKTYNNVIKPGAKDKHFEVFTKTATAYAPVISSFTLGSAVTSPTSTPKPTATSTPKPTATSTPQPTATSTPKPTATSTPKPTATPTPKPTATSTPKPTATPTPKPTATSTPKPTATPTPKPTATQTPTATPTQTPKPTATPTISPLSPTSIVTDTWKNNGEYYTKINVTITNTGGKVVDWRLKIPFLNGIRISSGSNCLYSFSGGVIKVSAASWNKTINPSASVSFELIVVSSAPFSPSISYIELDRESANPSPTPSPTNTATPTPRSTGTPTATPTPTPKATLTPTATPSPKPTSAPASNLPRNIVIGYWENWRTGVTLKLRDVDPRWDVVNVSFMLTDSSGYKPVFEIDSSVYPSSDRVNEFKNDIQILQSRGAKVLISFGGEKGYDFNVQTDAQRDAFLQGAIDIIEKYGFDGLDVDIEKLIMNVTGETSITNPTKPINKNLIYILRKLSEHFSTDDAPFIISMAPEHPYVQGGFVEWSGWGSIYGGYLPVLNNVRDILTYIHPQYYNNEISYPTFNGYNSDSLVKLSDMLIEGFDVARGMGHFDGLRPDQVAICVLRAGTGALDNNAYKKALSDMIAKYPDFRGIAIWSINEEERQSSGNPFLTAMRSVID